MVDDATNRLWAQFFEEETTHASYDVLEGWILADAQGHVLHWAHPAERQESVRGDALPRVDYSVNMQTFDGEILELYAAASRKAGTNTLDWWSVLLVMLVGTVLLVVVIYSLLLRLVIKPVERMAAASRARW